jgi:proline iminopeptidase
MNRPMSLLILASLCFGSMMISQILATPAASALAEPDSITTGTISTEGATLFYKTLGDGDPIVVLHGGPGFDHRQFLPFIWELAAEHQVILFDQRGTGLSDAAIDSANINVTTFIADIEAVRRHFGIEQMNLLGHSWGGILAMYYALRHPEQLRSLVLCSTTASVEAFDEMRANYATRRTEEDQVALEEIGGSEAFNNGDPGAWERFWRIWFRSYFADPAEADRMDLFFPPRTIQNCGSVAGLVLGSIGSFDLHEELAAVRCPTLILHGMADPMPASYAERIHDAMPGSELVLAPAVGHWFFVDGTEIFTERVLDFLRQIPKSGPEP